jgi:hypothetical protein
MSYKLLVKIKETDTLICNQKFKEDKKDLS